MKLLSFCYLMMVCAVTATGQTIPKLKIEKYTLPNGLQVILQQDSSIPMVSVNIWYHVGSGNEQVGRTGFAHLFEHIMFMGSKNVPTGAFDQYLEAAGATNNGSTTEDRTNYYETLPSNALALAMWLDSDRMGFLLPALDQEKLDLQRDVVKNERRQRVDNVPYGRADETILAALYPKGHPYSWPVIGSMEDLSAATLEDVQNFFRTYYAPNNATLAIVGDFDVAETKALIERYFGDIPRGPEPPAQVKPPAVVLQQDTFLVLEDRVQLPRVYYTWPSVEAFHKDDAALTILSSILAEGKNSRLYKTLVYDLQVAQNVIAYQGGSKLAGAFQIIVTPKPGQAPMKIDSIVRQEIAKVIQEGITERELARVQNSLRLNFLMQLQSAERRADLFNTYNFYVGTPDYVQQDFARYGSVTTSDVQRVAQTYLGKPKVVLTVVPEGATDTMVTGVAP
jgi:zinc protease